uniref:Si:ch211-241f5.3 n=1 Tax=Tetraodon nigroviridis TaxID=99883 RepID=H3DMH1_TETNG
MRRRDILKIVKTYYNECQSNENDPDEICKENATCTNTEGSFYCKCLDGFRSSENSVTIPKDYNECQSYPNDICGKNATCTNMEGSFYCECLDGFLSAGNSLTFAAGSSAVCNANAEIDQCQEENLCASASLQKLLSMIDSLLSTRILRDNSHVSAFLDLVESSLRLIGLLIDPPGATRTSNYTGKYEQRPWMSGFSLLNSSVPYSELQILVRKGSAFPRGAVTLSSEQTKLNIQLETAAGDPSSYPGNSCACSAVFFHLYIYKHFECTFFFDIKFMYCCHASLPLKGFTTLALLSYSNLEKSADGFFSGMKPKPDQDFGINSKITTIIVSNNDTRQLSEPVTLTIHHLKPRQTNRSHTCVFWDSSEDGGTWSPRGCSTVDSNSEYTVCSCSHLSSFAVLMSLYEMEDHFELQMMTSLGLSLSLLCLFVCILTFSLIRSIQSPRTTIHLHLCISLFLAFLVFLTSISQTKSQVGCALVAGLLHFFYLAAFCWMCLEGIQLFRMVVLVFNTNFKTLYMMVGGYGVPAVIVGISAFVNPKGYGTKRYCWLNLDFIWSFFGPVCVIIIVNIFFFLITVWKLAQKFSSLNPDLNRLQKIRVFTITAMAQLCVLGTMWIFGCFQFGENTIIMSYLFTIFGSLQGVMLFVMHCLFSKQVREEYVNILSRLCASTKK